MVAPAGISTPLHGELDILRLQLAPAFNLGLVELLNTSDPGRTSRRRQPAERQVL